jgi:3-hydroxyisobutyrate dehydrogenase-like beta-hydroxyacid dehydrogenase
MAGRLLDEGHEVRVWNRSPGPVGELVARGATAAVDAADAMSADITLAMLADDAAAEAVLTAEVMAAGAGTVFVHTSSISPAEVDVLAARAQAAGLAYVGAPVLGRPPVAAAGKLNIMVAGPAEAIERARPVLESLSTRVWPIGERARLASVVKVAMNYNLLHTIQSIGESVAMVERHGVAPADFIELMTGTLYGGAAHTIYGNQIANRAYDPPGFAIALGRKDLGLAEEVAGEVDLAMPVSPIIRAVYDRALQEPDLRESDWGAAAEVTRRGLLGQPPGDAAPDHSDPTAPDHEGDHHD